MTDNSLPAVENPCIRVCRMNEPGGWCLGCFRTSGEIRGWFRIPEEEKRAIVAELPARRQERLLRLDGSSST